MTRRPRVAPVVLALVVGRAAHAEPQLTLLHEPPPRHLRMRPRAAAVTPPASPARAVPPVPAAPPQLAQLPASASDEELTGLRDVRDAVSFSLTVGYQVDGARPSGKASLDAPVQAGRDYSALRSYGFGELFLSTRGVVLDSLSSYFALRFDAAQQSTYRAPGETTETRVAPPISTWFERTTFQVRTGWAEIKDFLPSRAGLRKIRFRAGNQYVYGPWVLHLDGALLSYDGDIVTATAYAGGRHTDYTTDLTAERYAVIGASLRIDLRKLAGLPVALTADTLSMSSNVAGQADSAHRQLEVDWQPRKDVTVLAQVRTLDDKIANERIQLRARYRQVTNLVVDVMRRFDTDWRWDPTLISASSEDPMAARRYLDLGPVLPQLIASLRAGTLIAENVDLLARTTIAADLTRDGEPKSSFSNAYVELGGALEVRLRRQLAVGASWLTRQSNRADSAPIVDERLVAQPLPASAATGEDRFTELGTRVRMSLGARRFSTMLEIYGRRTTYPRLYLDPTNPIDTSDLRGGGRFTVDAWIGKRVRLFVAYDLSTAIERSPEITSYKSLRLTMTGVY
ncbi:MAG: hypothetical protein ABIY55_19320 [Kofleriaceae bacterium]